MQKLACAPVSVESVRGTRERTRLPGRASDATRRQMLLQVQHLQMTRSVCLVRSGVAAYQQSP
jgi:hypothetical protein